MNFKRILVEFILIVILGAAILIYKIKTIPENQVIVNTEPIPVKVTMPEINGSEPPPMEVKTMINEHTLYVLAHLMGGEAGADWCTDKMQLYTGSVILNRIDSEFFPNTIDEVAFQKDQYACTKPGGGYWKEPTERTVENARYLLIHGSQLPEDYVWQANFKQGHDIIKEQNMYFGKK